MSTDTEPTIAEPARSFDEIPNIPNWKNLAPRVSAVYDLTGDAKTSLKVSVNKYHRNFTTDFANRYNPLVLQTDTRNWSDCDFITGTSTCSPLSLPTNRDNSPTFESVLICHSMASF